MGKYLKDVLFTVFYSAIFCILIFVRLSWQVENFNYVKGICLFLIAAASASVLQIMIRVSYEKKLAYHLQQDACNKKTRKIIAGVKTAYGVLFCLWFAGVGLIWTAILKNLGISDLPSMYIMLIAAGCFVLVASFFVAIYQYYIFKRNIKSDTQ